MHTSLQRRSHGASAQVSRLRANSCIFLQFTGKYRAGRRSLPRARQRRFRLLCWRL